MSSALWVRLGAHALKTRLTPDILALSGVRMWGAVTPIGGVLFLIGWLILMFLSSSASAFDRLGP